MVLSLLVLIFSFLCFLSLFTRQSLCESSPCQNDGTCIPDFEQNSHQCDCKAGFAGVHCEGILIEWKTSFKKTLAKLKLKLQLAAFATNVSYLNLWNPVSP